MHAAMRDLHKSPSPKLRLLGAGAYEAPKGRDFPFHQHTEWELVYYRSGNIEFLLGDEIVPVEPGVLLFAPPHIPHAERALTAYANFHLLVSKPPPVRWPRLCFDDAGQSLNRICAQLVDEVRATTFEHGKMLELLTGQLAIGLERAIRDTPVSSQERIVRKAEILIGKDFTQPLRISEVVEQAGASASSLRSLFARLRGCSPLEYLQKVRLQHAFTLLTTSDLTLEHIAALSGYHSASHLSRHIKRVHNRSPGSLRRGRRKRQA